MANENSKKDDNRIAVLLGVTDDASAEVRRLLVDPTTGRLKVSATISSNFDDLADVIITGAGTADVIYYSGTAWVNLGAGTSGRFLKTNGTASAPEWAAATAGAAGLDTQIQFNDGGVNLGGDAGLTYNKTTDAITVGTAIVDGKIGIGTTVPAYLLDVNGTAEVRNFLIRGVSGTATISTFNLTADRTFSLPN